MKFPQGKENTAFLREGKESFLNRVERARDRCRVRLGEGGQRQVVVQSLDLIIKPENLLKKDFKHPPTLLEKTYNIHIMFGESKGFS